MSRQTHKSEFPDLRSGGEEERRSERRELTHPTLDPPRELLGHIHRVGDGDNNELRAWNRWPVKEVVDDVLLGGEELVELVHQDDAARGKTIRTPRKKVSANDERSDFQALEGGSVRHDSLSTVPRSSNACSSAPGEVTLESSQCRLRRYLLPHSSSSSSSFRCHVVGVDGSSADGFPEDNVGVAWVGDLEAVDLDVLEGGDLLKGRNEKKAEEVRGGKTHDQLVKQWTGEMNNERRKPRMRNAPDPEPSASTHEQQRER